MTKEKETVEESVTPKLEDQDIDDMDTGSEEENEDDVAGNVFSRVQCMVNCMFCWHFQRNKYAPAPPNKITIVDPHKTHTHAYI